MDALHFLHQFFEFHHGGWSQLNLQRHVTIEILREYFSDLRLRKRNLRIPSPTSFEQAMLIYEGIQKREVELEISFWDPDHSFFPVAMTQFTPREKLPALLYVRGNVEIPTEERLIGVVGTRSASEQALGWTRNFVRYYRSLDLRICSGLALGIDQMAHLECPNSVAVLGSGLDQIYPYENQFLVEIILASQGTLLSQFPLLQVPLARNFPQRNRWIAALSAGILVVEGAEKSGAAITGKLALEMGKNTVTLTQNFRTAFGRGAVRLYEAGATLVTDEKESLQALFASRGGFAPNSTSLPSQLSFTLEEFRNHNQMPLPEAICLLETACRAGQLSKVGKDRFRLSHSP